MDRTTLHRRRRGALLGASALALVFAAAPERAAAQAFDRGFQGTPTVNAGAATVTTAANSTTVDVTNARTVITWTPSSTATTGTIDFLPSGTSTTFVSPLGDYTILNRIVPGGDATIGLNGSIRSFVSPGPEQSPVTGGNVWLYTPNGFVIGGGAVMNVGGLLLTTNEVIYSNGQNGVSFTDANGAINLRGGAGSKGSIVNNGTISANSYVAMVAPRIEQRGSVSADRSIAYVAGEEVDLTVDAGMFGITVLTGTTDAEGIVHTGTTTGSQSAGFFDPKTISFIAIPKNDAMTMLLSGSIGYVPAESVFDDGGSIVLTAGDEASPAGNIRIGAGEFTNRVIGHATGDLTVAPAAPEASSEGTSDTIFRSYTDLTGEQSVHITAAGGTRIQADNGLRLLSGNEAAAGTIEVEAFSGLQSGTIAVSGTLEAIAEHRAQSRIVGDIGPDAQGGSIAVRASGGTISADGLYLSAFGEGGRGNLLGGNGTGGSIELSAGLGGTISTDFVSLYASGHGGEGYSFEGEQVVPGRGGIGRGGSIRISDSLGDRTADPDGGTLDLGYLNLSASAVGGNSASFGSGLGGDAFGGTIGVLLDRQNFSASALYGYATAQDGDSAVDPVGGDITMTVGGGISVDLGELYLNSSASTGINGPANSFARGGTIDLSVIEGATLRTEFSLGLQARADTTFFFSEELPSSTANLTGGDIAVNADGGTIEAGYLYVDVGAYNYGATTRAGFAHGGTASVTAANGGSVATRTQDGEATPSFEIYADAYAGAGTAVGESRGGNITLAALSGGTIAAPGINIVLGASGHTGSSSTAGTNGAPAFGGTIAIDAIGGAIAAPIEAYAFGEGGTADFAAGSGTGGSIDVRVLEGGSLTGNLQAQAYGLGGASLSQGDGGDGTGGAFTLTSDALAQFTASSIDFQGYGQGGEAAAGAGGDGYGGSADVDVLGGEINWSYGYFNVSAGGARSQGFGSLAGSAFGDAVGARFHLGGGASLTIGDLYLDASAYADANGGGNVASGGSASLLVDGGASLDADSITLGATGYLSSLSFDPLSADSTPTVRGGTASLIADGGSVTASLIEVVADADTAGALTSAGTATGGTATLGAANGGSIAVDFDFSCEGLCSGGLFVHANGYGAEGPSAANAFGGTATVYTQGGTITSPYDLEVSADALAGNYAGFFNEFGIPSSGFDATGGIAAVEMRAGGAGAGGITVPSLTVSAQGRANAAGSAVGDGGDGTGGTATLVVAEGSLDGGFGLSVLANGYGGAAGENGEGTAAFQGGAGQGGTASLILSGGTANGQVVAIEAVGEGAHGEGSNEGATPSLAGNGTGGSAVFRATAGSLIVLGFGEGGGDFRVDGAGIGGEGAFNPNGGSGGTGGTGLGGSALFEAPSGSSAELTIATPIAIAADGVGGSAGLSTSETAGTGGDALGGSAAMRLADIPFAFGQVVVSGSGYGGFGGVSGVGNGGSAEFSLIDSGTAAAARSLSQLTLHARASDYTGLVPNGAGGSIVFNARAGNIDAGMAIGGDLLFDASGASAPEGNGFFGSIAGAPVAVGGAARLVTPRDAVLNITAPGALAVTGDLTVEVGRTFTSTGTISTLANASVVAPGGISMTDLSSGGTTLLSAVNGPVTVSNNLLSGGPVTVLGRSVNLVSLGALSFADADATAGDLSIRTEEDLNLTTVDAAGAVTLVSSGGDVHNTGAVNGTDLTFIAGGDVISDTALSANGNLTVDAGGLFVTPTSSASATGNVSLSADLGLALASVVSGGTTVLQSDAGAIDVASLTSPGAVTAQGQSVTIASPGALTFTSAQASAGDLQIATAGSLTIGQATASATTSLTSASGAVSVANLLSGGPVTAGGTAVTIGSTGALSFADLDATAGNVNVQAAGNLAVNTVDATGSITLVSTGGSLAATGALSGVGITLGSFNNLTLGNPIATSGALSLTSTNGAVSASGPVAAGGDLAVSGLKGITLGSVASGGTTTLGAADGAIAVSNLASSGPVSASGRAVDIASTGSLTFAGLTATAGNARVSAAGGLGVANASASGALTLTSSGGAVSSTGTMTAGGAVAVSGNTGVALNRLASGGTTTLSAPNGTLSVADLTSAGAVTAAGRSVAIGSSGALGFADLDATAGNLAVNAAGGLAVNTVDATGAVALISSGGAITASGAVTSGGNLAVSGNTGVTLGTATSGGAANLSAVSGAIGVANLASSGPVTASGRAVAIGSTGALNVASAQATGGNLAVTTGQGLTVGTAAASGTLALNAGGNLSTSGAITGAGITLSGVTVTAGGLVQSSAALALTAQQLLTLNALVTGTAITATSGDITIGSTGRLGSRGLTQTLRIMSQGTSAPINLGGTGTSGQFSLDQGEATRVFADQSITVAGGGDIRIGALAMSYGPASTANIGSGGTLKVDTSANVLVNGAVSLATSSAGDTFSIDPQRIEVVAGSGSIAMLGASGAPLGTLILEGGTIIVADQAVITAIGSSSDLTAIRQLLDQPSATPSESGFLQAGSIDVLAGEALYIQNTGASTSANARRGFTASAFNIDTGSSSTRIAVNGVIAGPAGTLTGRQAINSITINGQPAGPGGSFDALSTINGCIIGSSCTTQGAPTSSDLDSPVVNDLGNPILSGDLVQLGDNEPLITPPLVDEPITGVGNDDLWQVHCDAGDDTGDCPAGEGETE